jgi:hypothetical protein
MNIKHQPLPDSEIDSAQTVHVAKQNKINKLHKQEKIVPGGDQNSQNSGPHLDVDDEEGDESYGIYG